jgi:hypothetical protein
MARRPIWSSCSVPSSPEASCSPARCSWPTRPSTTWASHYSRCCSIGAGRHSAQYRWWFWRGLGHGGRDDRRRVQLVGFRSADCSGGIPRDPRARRAIIDRVWKIERLRMLSPGLEDNCSSSARNRLPNRSSLNSHSASSRSTHVSGDFASAIEACRRLRTVSFAIQHRVKVAHGSFVSHLRELLARIICKSLKIIRKLWVIESTPVRLPCTSTVVACSL